MNIKRVLGGCAAGLTAVVGSTAQAADVYWTGPSGEDYNWTTGANWDPNAPSTADVANFTNGNDVVKLDTSVTIAGKGHGYAKIYNDDPVDPAITNKLTLTDSFYLANIEADGNLTVESTGGDANVKGTLKATGGARMILHKVDFSDNGGQKFIASGSGTYMQIPCLWYGTAGYNKNVSFESYDHAEMSITPAMVGSKYRNPLDKISLKAVNANLYMNGSGNSITKAIDAYCEGCYMDITTLQPATAGTSITFVNGGMLRLRGTTKLPNGNYASTLTLCDGCALEQYSAPLYLNNGLTIKLAPTLESSATEGLITTKDTKTGASITLASGVKFEIDCSVFTNFYGKKTMKLIQQCQSGSSVSYAIPAAANVKLTGADNCTAAFTQVDKDLMLTITSRNLPEGTVAVIDGVAAFDSLQAAFDAAGADDVVTLVNDVTLTDGIVVNNSVALDVGTFTVSSDAEVSSGALFCITNGGNLAVTGSGTVAGGANKAVYVTNGAFYVPATSAATFTAVNDAVVFHNAGNALDANICGGNFASTDGAPVASDADTGYEPLAGFLEGGKYNKQPASELIADGYKAEEVGENQWEVVLEGPAICTVNGRYFASLQKAYESVPDQGDIFIISNATVEALTMNRNITFWIDLKGHTLTPEEENGTIFTVAAGTVYLYDNPESGDSAGKLEGGVVVNGGTVSITMSIDADPALTVNGGTVTAKNTMNGSVVLNNGTLTMNATVNADGVAITAKGGKLDITGGSYTGDTSAFVADGIKSANSTIDNASFSSEVPVAYLKGNRKMEQQGDRWVVVLASDEKAVTYTWKDEASGAWTNKANWTANIDRPFGYPDSLNLATVTFPKTMETGDEIVLDKSVSVLKVNWENTNAVKMVVDNAKLTLRSGLYSPYTKRSFEPGVTGPVDFVIKGENPQIECQSEWSLGAFRFGSSNYVMNIAFELPVTPWSSQQKSPLYVKGTGNPVYFGTGVNFTIDAKNVVVPEAGTTVTNFLAYATDKGVRFDEWDWEAPHPREFKVINAPAGAKCDLIAVWDKGLFFTVSRQPGMMLYIK